MSIVEGLLEKQKQGVFILYNILVQGGIQSTQCFEFFLVRVHVSVVHCGVVRALESKYFLRHYDVGPLRSVLGRLCWANGKGKGLAERWRMDSREGGLRCPGQGVLISGQDMCIQRILILEQVTWRPFLGVKNGFLRLLVQN